MVVIGVDPHKASHTAAALEQGTHQKLGTLRVEATLAEYGRLLRWAKRFDERRWAVENAWGLGRHLTQWLIARGETVVDVAATATARVRELSRGGRRKTDVLDAAAAASVVALQGDTAPVAAEAASTVLRMLDERRVNLTQQRTRTVNQVHALLRELRPGGAPLNLTADHAAALLTRIRPASPVEHARKDLARELVADIRAVDTRLVANRQRMQQAVGDCAGCPRSPGSVRWWPPGCSAAPDLPCFSPRRRRSRSTAESRRSRSPVPTRPAIGCRVRAIAS
jgi:transposase